METEISICEHKSIESKPTVSIIGPPGPQGDQRYQCLVGPPGRQGEHGWQGYFHQNFGERLIWKCDRCGESGKSFGTDEFFRFEEIEHLLASGCPGSLRLVDEMKKIPPVPLGPIPARLVEG